MSLRDSHRVEQWNIKFHIGESVVSGRRGWGAQLTRLWLMAPAPSPNDCSPSLLAINKNIYIFILFIYYYFFFLFTQSALSRSFHSYPPFTLHHAHVNLGTINHLTQDVIKPEKNHRPVKNGGFIYFSDILYSAQSTGLPIGNRAHTRIILTSIY